MINFETIVYPVLARPKLKGVRCRILNSAPETTPPIMCRSMLDILNGLPALDGELVVGNPIADNCAAVTREAMADSDGFTQFTYWVYDVVLRGKQPFNLRNELAKSWVVACGPGPIKYAPHALIKAEPRLRDFQEKMMLAGYPDIVVHGLDDAYEAPPQA